MNVAKVRAGLAALLLSTVLMVPSLAHGAESVHGLPGASTPFKAPVDSKEMERHGAEEPSPMPPLDRYHSDRIDGSVSQSQTSPPTQTSSYGDYISISVTDDFTDIYDHVINLGVHALSVEVTDSGGQPVANAQILLNGQSWTSTGSNGKAVVSADWQYRGRYEVRAVSGSMQSWTTVFALEPGWGLVNVVAKDRQGYYFNDVSVRGFQVNADGSAKEWFGGSSNGGFSQWISPAGPMTAVVHTPDDAPEYYYMTGEVNVPDMAATTLQVSGADTVPLTVHMTDAGASVAGAEIWPTLANVKIYIQDPVARTGSDGTATIRVTKDRTYFVAASGPNQVGYLRDIGVSTTGASVELDVPANAPTVNFTVGGAHQWSAIWVNPGMGSQYVRRSPGSFRITPGGHYMEAGVGVPDATDSSRFWEYWFFALQGGRARWQVNLAPGQTLDFAIDPASMSPYLEVAPRVEQYMSPELNMRVGNGKAAVHLFRVWEGSNYDWVDPTLTLKDSSDEPIDSSTDWSLDWYADELGTYKLTGSFSAGLGSYFPAEISTSAPDAEFEVVEPWLQVHVEDDFGDPTDLLVPADGQIHTLKFTVSDGTAPEPWAEVWWRGELYGWTDAQGKATVKFKTDAENQTAYFTVTVPNQAEAYIDLAMVEPGYALVTLNMLDHTGQNPVDPDWVAARLFGADDDDWWLYGPAVPVKVGTYKFVAAAIDSARVPYLLEGTVDIAEPQKRLTVSVDPSTMDNVHPFTVTVKNGSELLGDVSVLFLNDTSTTLATPPTVTNKDGVATLYTNMTGTFSVMTASSDHHVFGRFNHLASEDALDFAEAPILNYVTQDGHGNPVTTGRLYVGSPNFFGEFYLELEGAGAYRVAPENYIVYGAIELPQDDSVYEYIFRTKEADRSQYGYVTFSKGDEPRTFTAGGSAWASNLKGPANLVRGKASYFTLQPESSSAVLVHTYRAAKDGNWGHTVYPTYEVKDSTGTVVATEENDDSMKFTPTEAAVYTITGTLSEAGPLFGDVALSTTVNMKAAEPGPALSLSRPWVKNQGDGTVTVTVTFDGLPEPDVTVSLPYGSRVNGSLASSAVTDSQGRVTFTLDRSEGGPAPVTALVRGEYAGQVLLVTDDQTWGILKAELTGMVQTAALPMGQALIALPKQADGSYGQSTGYHGMEPGYYLVEKGTYGVIANPEGYYLTRGDVVVQPGQVTTVSFDLSQTKPIQYSAALHDGNYTRYPMAAMITGLGPASMTWLTESDTGTIRVMPGGSYGFSFTFFSGGNVYMMMEPDVQPDSSHDYQYSTTDPLARVVPGHLGTQNAAPMAISLLVSSGNAVAEIGYYLDGPTALYFKPGTVTLEGYELRIDEGMTDWSYPFRRGGSGIALVAGENPTVWKDLGGDVTATLTVENTHVRQGENLNFQLHLTTEAGDRLQRVIHFNAGGNPNMEGWLYSENGSHFLGSWLTGSASAPVRSGIPDGVYSLRVTQPAGLYGTKPWVAETTVLVGPRVQVRGRTFPSVNPGHYVEPGGRIGLEIAVYGANSPSSLDLGVRYNPAQVALTGTAHCFVQGATVDCAANGITMEDDAATGVLLVRWSGAGTLPRILVEFQAKPDFAGNTTFEFTEDSTIKESGVPVPPADVRFSVLRDETGVANRAVSGFIDRIGPTSTGDLAVWVTDSTGVRQRAWVDGRPTASHTKYAVFNLPLGTLTATTLAISPGYLVAEATAQSADALITVPTITLKFGDLNVDGKIDGADLAMYAEHYGQTGDSYFSGLADTNGDQAIDLLDLARIARNYTPEAEALSNAGGVHLTIQAPAGITLPAEAKVTLLYSNPVGEDRSLLTTVVRLNASGETVVDLTRVPAIGTYTVQVEAGTYTATAYVSLTSDATESVTLTLGTP